MEKRMIEELSIVSTDSEISLVEELLEKNTQDTIFVTGGGGILQGIISIGDWLRKRSTATNAEEMMNRNFLKIIVSEESGFAVSEKEEKDIFAKSEMLRDIPVTDEEGRLLYVFPRGRRTYDFEMVEKILALQEYDEEFAELLKALGLKKVGIIATTKLLNLFGEVLRQYLEVIVYQSYEEYEGGGEDVILVRDTSSLEARRLKERGINIWGCTDFWVNNDKVRNVAYVLRELSKVVERILVFGIPTITKLKKLGYVPKDIDHESIICAGLDLEKEARCEYMWEVLVGSSVVKKRGYCFFKDLNSEYVNIVNGRRITTDDVGGYEHKIFVLGNSLALGAGSEDQYTIQSFMQRYLNNSKDKYRVINCGISAIISLYNVLEEVKKGDKIILVVGEVFYDVFQLLRNTYSNIDFFPLDDLFRDSCENIYWDRTHINHIGNKRVAKKILSVLQEDGNLGMVKRDGTDFLEEDNDDEFMQSGLAVYLEEIKKNKVDTDNAGAIVMNCNPFTYGHRHLIEYAAEQVEHLYIFVVEEDKSYFKFADRFDMVKKGTEDLPNVTVLPSGQFIISTVTFAEYFNKDALQGTAINPSMDIEIFAKHIASALSIGKRFAGEEPNCYITNQYNKAMREIFPKYGIEFVEIERKEENGKPISASTVRKLLEDGDMEEVRKIVPDSTMECLRHNSLAKK